MSAPPTASTRSSALPSTKLRALKRCASRCVTLCWSRRNSLLRWAMPMIREKVGQTNYAAAKAGVAAMTVTWAKELARYSIRVAGIAPGFSETRMVATIPPKVEDRIVSTITLRRFARPEEIAHAALFILQNDYYDGRILEIDGGLRI